MDAQSAIETLRMSEVALRARGVSRVAVFGSVARGENGPNSDLDVMVEIDPNAHLTLFDYVGLKSYIADMFDGQVDVVNRAGLRPEIAPSALAHMIYAF